MKYVMFWMLPHVALVGTDVSKESIASIMKVERIGELGTLAVTLVQQDSRSYQCQC
jgi:hypothetical protein